jgi:hypothetical protein
MEANRICARLAQLRKQEAMSMGMVVDAWLREPAGCKPLDQLLGVIMAYASASLGVTTLDEAGFKDYARTLRLGPHIIDRAKNHVDPKVRELAGLLETAIADTLASPCTIKPAYVKKTPPGR